MKLVDPVARLREFVDQHPTQRAAAKALNISAQYLSQLLSGARKVSKRMLRELGLRRAIVEKIVDAEPTNQKRRAS